MRLMEDDGAAKQTRSVWRIARSAVFVFALAGCGNGAATETPAIETAANSETEIETEPVGEEPETEPENNPEDEPVGSDEPDPEPDREPEITSFRTDRFFTHVDGPIRTALAEQAVAEVERGFGGRSLGFRITLADGTRGYFKPEQTFNGMNWYAEIAAYHLDRELGMGRTAPSIGRRIAFSELEEAARTDGRRHELEIDEDGTIPGAMIWWVPERLHGVELPNGWEVWLRIEGRPPLITPFQRPGQYRRAVAASREGTRPTRPTRVADPDPETRPAEMSDVIVFDYLIHNLDRFGGNNTNIRTIGDGGPVMFLDNAAGFTLPRPRVGIMDRRLRNVQRFRRVTIDAIRALDLEAYYELLDNDPLGPLLNDRQRENLGTRRDFLLEYVDDLLEEHGEEAVYPW